MQLKKILTLIICIAIPVSVGGISGFITSSEIGGWFASLQKPVFNPPNYLFAPVWTLLYTLMGISLYLIWTSPSGENRKKALQIFGVQLFFNFWWSILFFSFHLLVVSIVDILLMWLLIIYMIKEFRKIRASAAYMNIPYLLWVSFASILNISIWWLNK